MATEKVAEVVVDVSAERLWAALTKAEETEQYLMRSRVTVGDVGEAFRLEHGVGDDHSKHERLSRLMFSIAREPF